MVGIVNISEAFIIDIVGITHSLILRQNGVS